MENKDVVALLERLLEVSLISRKGFADAAQQVNDPVLQARFNQFAQQRSLYVENLSQMISHLGGSPKDAESFEGNLMRVWIEFKSGLIGHDRLKIIDQSLKEEQTTVIEFENALKEDLPHHVRKNLTAMNEEVKNSYQQLQNLKKEYN